MGIFIAGLQVAWYGEVTGIDITDKKIALFMGYLIYLNINQNFNDRFLLTLCHPY